MPRQVDTLPHPSLRRVVVTGIGAVTPAGNAKEFLAPHGQDIRDGAFWDNVNSGKSFVSAIKVGEGTQFETMELGARLPNFQDTLKDYAHSSQLKNTPTYGQYPLVAGLQAGLDAGILDVVQRAGENQEGVYALNREIDPERFAIKVAIAVGGDKAIEDAVVELMTRGPRRVSARTIPLLNPNKATTSLAKMIGVYKTGTDELDPEAALFLEGDSPTFACTSGAKSIWDIYRDIAYGEADVGMGGGSEDPHHPVPYIGFHKAGLRGVLVNYEDYAEDPTKASRPFDTGRKGLVMGQGAAIVVLEELNHALNRGAKIYAEVAGGCFMVNANHPLEPDARTEVKIMKKALQWAGLTPDLLEYINAHAAGTIGDRTEDQAVKLLMGAYLDKLLMSSSKSIFGHMMGGAGASEAVVTIKAIDTDVIPQTVNLDNPEDPEIDHVAKESKLRRIMVAASNSFGLDGTYGGLVFVRYPDWEVLKRAA